jgi:HPt (histidine-containing phosphotransfer) domain-containing protein
MYKYIDLTYLNEISGGDRASKNQIIEIFLTQMEETADNLKDFLAKGEYKKLSETAHTAKSSLRIMGIENIAQKMETLQNLAAKNENPESYQFLVNYFTDNIPYALKELKSELSSS